MLNFLTAYTYIHTHTYTYIYRDMYLNTYSTGGHLYHRYVNIVLHTYIFIN